MSSSASADGKTSPVTAKVGTTPLMVLRHFISNKKEIIEKDDLYIFGDIAYYKNAKTNFPIFKSNKDQLSAGVPIDGNENTSGVESSDNSSLEYYTLESLYYFLSDSSKLPHTMYIKKVVKKLSTEPDCKMQVVTRPDRLQLLEYLEGRTSKCDGIDPSAPIELPLPAPANKAQRRDSDGTTPSSDYRNTPCSSNNVMIKPPSQPSLLLTSQSNRETVLNAIKLPDAGKLFFPTCLQIKNEIDEEGKEIVQVAAANKDENSILSAMGQDKIQELKTKRRAVKVREVSSVPEIEDSFLQTGGPITKEQEEVLYIMSHERVYNTRNSILRTNNQEFLTTVSNIFMAFKIKDDRMKKFGPAASRQWDSPSYYKKRPEAPALPPPKKEKPGPPAPYSRYDQKDNACFETEEFGIKNPLQSFSLSFADGIKQTLDELPTKIPSPSPAKKMRRGQTPIIIVPDCSPSLITILNAKDFLEDSTFITDEAKKAAGCKKTSDVIIHRPAKGLGSVPGKTVPFKIICYPEKLGVNDWDRVVAIFVTGKSWQFKGWPWNANPVEICTRLNAYNLKYEDIDTDANVKQWPVQVIQVGRHRRHLDKASAIAIWTSLESFIQKSKPYLHY